ncbi:ABC transporter ATP-binding protein [Treponema sp.]|uniref:ABC transporter ATP-binding protein n=1 Tax=Treponema sp. TaxID=166 RepID=UPI00298E0782|nr:ABC transporter ATP-binding protein [Treponema sp.]MCR5614468.1 ABC transporter ATP-binding protein [Treponema sp.]
MSDIAIKAENLSKYYRLGVINNGTLFRDIQTWFALKRGKEDPHGQIGSHRYDNDKDGFWALDNLNFEIHQGDRVGIIGHNGAGKSTLLKVLSRITAPTEGKVKINGRVSSLLEVGTGFHPELTGRENIYLNGAILGMKRREVDRKIDEIIAFSEIEKHIDTPVKRYSSGMYVRLAFAVAAHLDSEILIADEVLAVGDAAFQKKALGKMNELSTRQGRTVLFVSHQMNAVESLCTSGVILNRGKIDYCSNNIYDVVSHYMMPSESVLETGVWQISETVKKHRNFSIKRLYITKNDEIVTKISRLDENVQCVIEAEVLEYSDLLNVGALLKKKNGEVVCATWLRDSQNIDKSFRGNVKFKFNVPNNILNVGEYNFEILAGLHHVEVILGKGDVVLPFSIVGSINTKFGDDYRDGAVVLLMPWEIE